jgi:hypothetical protein
VELPMSYSQSPPLAENEWLTGEEISSERSAHNPDYRASLRSGKRPLTAPILPPQLSEVTRDQRSIAGRIFRRLTRILLVFFIGVGATLSWQSYGDMTKEQVIARTPTLAWLLSISTTKPVVVVATSPGPAQLLEPLASNLNVVRRSVEQIAAKQEQLAQDIATLQAVEVDIRQKMSFMPPSPAPQEAPVPQQRPPQPRAPSSAVPSSSVSRSPPPVRPQLSR